MENVEIQKKLNLLEEKIVQIEKKKKDKWDIFNIIASLLIPASIAFAGYYFSNAIKEAEIRSSENLAAKQESIARINAKVGQAELISAFLEPLTGEDVQKKRVAIRGILIALPVEGPQIVSAVSESDPDKEIQKFANTELDKQRAQLIQNAFSSEKSVRIAATTELARGWKRDPKLVVEMVEYALHNISSKSGVINTLVVLQNVDVVLLQENSDLVSDFIVKAIPNGSQTASQAENVRERL